MNDFLYINILLLLFVLIYLLINPLYCLLIAFLFPNTVATHQYEIHVLVEVKLVRVRIGRDRLLLGLQVFALLVFQVTETAGQIQVAVDPALRDRRT